MGSLIHGFKGNQANNIVDYLLSSSIIHFDMYILISTFESATVNMVVMAEALNMVTFTPGVYTGGLQVLPSELNTAPAN